MPGLFGAVGVSPTTRDALVSRFLAIWPDSLVVRESWATIGAHAHMPSTALRRIGSSTIVGVDGELGIYDELQARERRALATRDSGTTETWLSGWSAAGSTCVIDERKRFLSLAADLSGSFPVFFARVDGGLAFCSLARPLAMAIGARPNPLSGLYFLRTATTIGGASIFDGVSRLRPGQMLRFTGEGTESIHDEAECWIRSYDVQPEQAIAELWDALHSYFAALSDSDMLMMSGGWDSRTLLAAATSGGRRIGCYSHGDIQSRELGLVSKLCGVAGVTPQLHAIDDTIFRSSLLDVGLSRTESLSFPHWLLAGERCKSDYGVSAVFSGVLGEILGGHYGPAMLGSSFKRGKTLLEQLLTPRQGRKSDWAVDPRQILLRAAPLTPAWYLAPDLAALVAKEVAHENDAIEVEILRHKARGVADPSAIVEAFISEHRGAQYIAAQMRSSRTLSDVRVPFGAPRLYRFASKLPLQYRVHNRMNQKLLKDVAPQLLQFPMAATLVSAGAPILVQEASRFVRVARDRVLDRATRSGGRGQPRPSIGWVNFNFLRHSSPFRELVDTIESDFFNKKALIRAVDDLQGPNHSNVPPHSLFDQMMKIVTLDRLISN